MTQTLAIFYDAYRCLNAKKMFWIVLSLSLLVVACMGAIGIDDDGTSVLWWKIASEPNTAHDADTARQFYNLIFSLIGIDYWLSWIAALLALISTASIFPDLITSGSIDMVLSKPISRLRLFFTQYLAGLLFVTLQVGVFSLASFFVIGLRGGSWQPALFMAVPLVVCFFSYLFAVCVLLGVLTRSTLAALLLTILFWFVVYIANAADGIISMQLAVQQTQVQHFQRHIDTLDAIAASGKPYSETQPAPAEPFQGRGMFPMLLPQTGDLKADRAETVDRREAAIRGTATFEKAQTIVLRIKTFLPKTNETVALLKRSIIPVNAMPGTGSEVQRKLYEQQRSRSVAWVVGTSLGFEAVMLALGAWVFCRRDY